MKTRIKTFMAATFAAILIVAVSCKGKTEQKNENAIEQTETGENQDNEYTAAYVCPMHCEGSGSDTEGTCPNCGMAYVENEEHIKDGHMH